MSLRELMKQEKAKRTNARTAIASSSSYSEIDTPSMCVVSSLALPPASKCSSSSGVMTGYESDDEAENTGAETDDGSVGSSRRPQACSIHPCGRKLRSRVEFEIGSSVAALNDLRATKKLRHMYLGPSHAFSIESECPIEGSPNDGSGGQKMPTTDESADSGYEGEHEGAEQRKKGLTHSKVGTFLSEGNQGGATLPPDFFDSCKNEKEDVDMEVPRSRRVKEEQTLLLASSEPDWVQQVLESEHLRIEEEYILEGESENEGREASKVEEVSGEKKKDEETREGKRRLSEILALDDRNGRSWADLVLGLDDKEELEESSEIYEDASQYQTRMEDKSERKRKIFDGHEIENILPATASATKVSNLPEGFFEDAEKDAEVRGKIAPSIRQERELEKKFKLFEHQLQTIEQQQEILRHRKEVDKQLNVEVEMERETKILQKFVREVKQRKKDFKCIKHEMEQRHESDEDSEMIVGELDVDTLIEMSWRKRRVV